MNSRQRINLRRLMTPRHIAFIGGVDAGVAIREARRIGFGGTYWPVNPRRDSLEGLPCFRNVHDLPAAPDAYFLAVPVGAAVEIVAQLRSMGAGGGVCFTAGFGEAGEEGRRAQAALVEAAGDMALVGPNCYGVINYLDKVALWPFAHGGASPGYGAAIVTQSGMLSSDLTMSDRSVPLSHMVSIGNQAVLRIEQLVDYLLDDDRVRAIGLHIEGLKDVGAFARAALKAVDLKKPIVALKTGSSAIGKALTSSHTGSLSGEDDLYDALFERTGIVRVHSPSQMLETLKYMTICGGPKGRKVAGFTCSGAGATMLADHAEKIGLEFAPFEQKTADELVKLLPPIATVSNPLDYTTPIWGRADVTGPIFAKALSGDFDLALLVQDYPAAGLDDSKPSYLADGNAFGDAAAHVGVPAAICSTLPENLDRETRAHFIGRGVAPMQGILETLDAMSAACKWVEMRRRIEQAPPACLVSVPAATQARAIDEVEGKSLLRDAGIPVPRGKCCAGADAGEIASEIGFPVALKMVHPDLQHKTDAGAVALNLDSADEVAAAVGVMRASVMAKQPAALSDRFLVEAMAAKPVAELIVSIRRDAQFGLAMTLGCGGVLVEILQDAVTLLLPVSAGDLRDALGELKISRLFSGYRGSAAVDLDRLAESLLGLARFAQDNADRIVEIEINPLFVGAEEVCAVDALIHVADS